MCGIVGIVYTDPKRPVDRAVVRRMTDTLTHRGPDAEGFLFGDGVALAHRRLSIIDLSAGDQPIFNEDGSRAVVFNGEIYNYRQLRETLAAQGHAFRTASDTETIVHAWEQYGDECVTHLRGMFGLALWDGRRRRLLLARDRLGKKPLYYTHDGDRLVFASELKALGADPSVKRAIDLPALDDYLSFGVVPAPRTIYQGIAQLPPAHYLVWEDGRVSVREYWDVQFETGPPRPEDEYVEEFETLLAEAVRMRLISDVPLGAFLSGGIDSSAVVQAMARESAAPVLTTSVAFRESEFNEAPRARQVAQILGTDHREVVVDANAVEILPTLAWHLDEPFADSSALPTYYLSRAARQQVTVALSGDGGDELFGGYAWRYGLNLLEDRVRRRLPTWFRSAVLAPAASVWPKADRLPRPLRWKHFMRNLSLPPERAYFHDMSWFTPSDKDRLLTQEFRASLHGHDSFTAFGRHFDRVAGLDALSRITYVDLKTYLPNDILVKVDRMAMANSLEVRAPLLDHTLVEFAARIPATLKFRGTVSKYLVKRHLERSLPASLVHRPKQGFSIPVARWLRSDLKQVARDLVLSERSRRRGYFRPDAVQRLWESHQSGQRDHAHKLWALMMLELWHRIFVDEAVAGAAGAGVAR